METASLEGLADERQPSHPQLWKNIYGDSQFGGISGLAAAISSSFMEEYLWRQPVLRD
jgi:hypothetical protein